MPPSAGTNSHDVSVPYTSRHDLPATPGEAVFRDHQRTSRPTPPTQLRQPALQTIPDGNPPRPQPISGRRAVKQSPFADPIQRPHGRPRPRVLSRASSSASPVMSLGSGPDLNHLAATSMLPPMATPTPSVGAGSFASAARPPNINMAVISSSGSQSARSSQVGQRSPILPSLPNSARSPSVTGSDSHTPAASHASLFPSQSTHTFPLPASVASIFNPALAGDSLPAASGASPARTSGIRSRHRISYKQRAANEYGLEKMSAIAPLHAHAPVHPVQSVKPVHVEEKRQESRTSREASDIDKEDPLADSIDDATTASSSSSSITDDDVDVVAAYLRSDACDLWAAATSEGELIASAPPIITTADVTAMLRACDGSSSLALQSLRNLATQDRRFTTLSALLRALEQVILQRSLIWHRITGHTDNPSSAPAARPAASRPSYNFFTNAHLTALLDLSAVDRLTRECPRTSPAGILRLLDQFESQGVRFQFFNQLIAAVQAVEEELDMDSEDADETEVEAAPEPVDTPDDLVAPAPIDPIDPVDPPSPVVAHSATPSSRHTTATAATPLRASSPHSPSPRSSTPVIRAHEESPSAPHIREASHGTAAEPSRPHTADTHATSVDTPVEPVWNDAPVPSASFLPPAAAQRAPTRLGLKPLREYLSFPTRTLFQANNSSLISLPKNDLASLMQAVALRLDASVGTAASSDDQEQLLCLTLFHLEWKRLVVPSAAALAKEVARFHTGMIDSLRPLLEHGAMREIEVEFGLTTPLTTWQRSTLHLHSMCGPYLHFHLRCLAALRHRVTTYAGLIESLQAQHTQFLAQRADEVRLLHSYARSLHCFLFWEQPTNLTLYECAQIIDFNAGIKRVVCKALATDRSNPAAAASTAVPSFSSLLGSENSTSVFQYFQLLQTIGCKFESASDLIAALQSLYVGQDAVCGPRADSVRSLLPQLGVGEASDADLFRLVYAPLHGGMQSVVHMQLLVAAGTHFRTIDDLDAMLTWSFLHSLEPPNSQADSLASPTGGSAPLHHLSLGSPANLFVYAFLSSPVACHMLATDAKAQLTLEAVQRLRDGLQEPVDPARPDNGQTRPINTSQFLRILYDLEEDSAAAVPSGHDDGSEVAHRVFESIADLAAALRTNADAFVVDKCALFTFLDGVDTGSFVVTSAQLDDFLDNHASSVPPASVLNVARALSAQGNNLKSFADLFGPLRALQDSLAASKAMLFAYLSSNTHRLLAKSCVIHDADLSALIAAATSGAAALLIMQRMEKELLLVHYTLEAQMTNSRLTAAQRAQLVEADAMLGGMSMAQLIRAVREFAANTRARWADVRHYLAHARLITDATFQPDAVPYTSLLTQVRGVDVLADVQVPLVWLFAHAQRFTTWDHLVQAMRAGVRNGPSNFRGGSVEESRRAQFALPSDEQMMLMLHLFGPVCSLLKAGTLFMPGEFTSLLTAAGDSARDAFQHLISLQRQSRSFTSIAKLIEAVSTRHAQLITRKQQVWTMLSPRDCRLFETAAPASTSAAAAATNEVGRFQVTLRNVDRLFVLAQTDADLPRMISEACAPPRKPSSGDTPLPPPSHLSRHAPYRFFAHLAMAVRGLVPQQYAWRGRATGRGALDDASEDTDQAWRAHTPIHRLATGTSPLLHDPMTDAPLALDAGEVRQVLAAADSNVHVCAMHLQLLEVLHRRFTSVHALLVAVRAAQRESLSRMAELREYVQNAATRLFDADRAPSKLSQADLAALYYNSGAGPLCALFLQEMIDAGDRVSSVANLVTAVRGRHARFVARRDAEMGLLRVFFRSAYDVRQVFARGSATQIGAHISDTELSQLLLAGETGAGVMTHVQHLTLSGSPPLASVAALHASLAGGVLPSVLKSALSLLRDPSSELLHASAHAEEWTEAEVDQLMELSTTGTDALIHLWALQATTTGFDGVASLAAAMHAGRIGCLDPLRAQHAILLAYLHSPTVHLLPPPNKRDLGVSDVEKLVRLCGGGVEHTFAMLLKLDERNLQFHSILDLAHEMLDMHEARQTSRPVTAIARARREQTPAAEVTRRISPIAESSAPVAAAAPAPVPTPAASSTVVPTPALKSNRRSTAESLAAFSSSAIYALVRNPASQLMIHPADLQPKHVALLLQACDENEPRTLALLTHLSRSHPRHADVSALVAALHRSHAASLAQIAQLERFLNQQPRLTLFEPPRTHAITTNEAEALYLRGDAGLATIDIVRSLDMANRQFSHIAVVTFESVDQLGSAIKMQSARQSPAGSNAAHASGDVLPPVSLVQSPVARAARLTSASRTSQIARFLTSSHCHLFPAPVDTSAPSVAQLISAGGAGRDTLAQIWSLDAAGRIFTSLGDLATAVHARHALYNALARTPAMQQIDTPDAYDQIESFLTRIHARQASSGGAWLSARLFDAVSHPPRTFDRFDRLAWALEASDLLAAHEREKLLSWLTARSLVRSVDDSPLVLSDVDRLLVESEAPADAVWEYLRQMDADRASLTSVVEVAATIRRSYQSRVALAAADRRGKVSPSQPRTTLADLAAHRQLQATHHVATESLSSSSHVSAMSTGGSGFSTPGGSSFSAFTNEGPRAEPKPRRTPIALDLTPVHVKHELLLAHLRHPYNRMFDKVGVIQEITAYDLDRLLKMGGGPAVSADECIAHLRFLHAAGNNRFRNMTELCFAVLKHQRAVQEAAKLRAASRSQAANVTTGANRITASAQTNVAPIVATVSERVTPMRRVSDDAAITRESPPKDSRLQVPAPSAVSTVPSPTDPTPPRTDTLRRDALSLLRRLGGYGAGAASPIVFSSWHPSEHNADDVSRASLILRGGGGNVGLVYAALAEVSSRGIIFRGHQDLAAAVHKYAKTGRV